MKLTDRASLLCIGVSNWFSHPIAITVFPIGCAVYLLAGGHMESLTLILSVLAISLTQMVLNAQSVDMEQTKLQIAELIKVTPKANNIVIKEDLTPEQMRELEEEIQDAVSEKL